MEPGTTNLILQQYNTRYALLPEEKQRQLDELKNWNWKEHQLKTLKKSRIPPQVGDLFVFSPKDGIFFMGRVIETNIQHKDKDIFIDGKNIVFLFRSPATGKERGNFVIDYNNLLGGPMIVDASYWRKGLFETIGNESITNIESNMDYGFYSATKGLFCKADGTKIYQEPKYYGIYGISTIIAVAMLYAQESIFDEKLQ